MSISFHEADYESDNGNDGEDEEEDFGNFNRTCGDTTEAEHGSNQCNDKKYDRVIKHVFSWQLLPLGCGASPEAPMVRVTRFSKKIHRLGAEAPVGVRDALL